jgi:hypothetical protein
VRQLNGSTDVNENGSTDTFTVALNKAPTSNVVISVTSNNTGEAVVSPGSLTFTPSDWNSPQTVTVTGVDDSNSDGNQTTGIVLAVVDSLSADEYDSVSDQTINVTTNDNEPDVRIAPAPFSPANGTKLNGLGTTLSWRQDTNAVWYQVQVIPFNSDGPGINLIIGDPALVPQAQFVVEAPDFGTADPDYVMLPDLTYTWRVRTANVTTAPAESEWSAWSTPSTFDM